MGTTYEDIAYEMYLLDLEEKRIWQQSKLRDCIYLFVEGETEEAAFPILFDRLGYDYREESIIIANYNGNGNVRNAIRLMRKTLSNERPILVSIDNDAEGHRIATELEKGWSSADSKLWVKRLPEVDGKIPYADGHSGGSFEEMFHPDDFINCVFALDEVGGVLLPKKEEFIRNFDQQKLWLNQIKGFAFKNGLPNFLEDGNRKKDFGMKLATDCKVLPQDILDLIEKLKSIRRAHPIRDIRYEQED